MQRFYETALDLNGNPASGVSVSVTDLDTGLPAAIYLASDNTLDATNVKSNPFVTDATGVASFAARNVAPFVHFVDCHYQSTGIPTKQRNGPDFWT